MLFRCCVMGIRDPVAQLDRRPVMPGRSSHVGRPEPCRAFITRIDRPWVFRAALAGTYDGWEEWYLRPSVRAARE